MTKSTHICELMYLLWFKFSFGLKLNCFSSPSFQLDYENKPEAKINDITLVWQPLNCTQIENPAYDYLAFLDIGESVLIFIPFITGIAQEATG